METISGLGESLPAANSAEKFAHASSGPGILVLSRTVQVLHVNRRALELAGRIGQAEIGSVSGLLSTPVAELYLKVREVLERGTAASIWELFEERRIVGEPGRRVLLLGYGLTDRNSSDRSRVVIIFEEEDPNVRGNVTEQAEEPLPLANVEKAVA